MNMLNTVRCLKSGYILVYMLFKYRRVPEIERPIEKSALAVIFGF